MESNLFYQIAGNFMAFNPASFIIAKYLDKIKN